MKKRKFVSSPRDGQPLTTADKREMRRRRARRQAIVRAVLVVVLLVAVVLLWQNWEYIASGRLISGVENLVGAGTGSYPVDMAGTHVSRLAQVNNYAAVLTDSHLIYLNHTGAEVNRYTCAYPTALMRTAGKYVLVAEQGGRRLHLSTRSKVVKELTTDADILSVALNKKGQIAVMTDGPQGYAVQIKVYDKTGKLLYTRNRNHMGTDITLSPDGDQLAVLSVEAVGGNLNTTMDVFSLKTSATESLCSYVAKDRLLYRMAYLDGGWVAAFSDDCVVMLDTADGLVTVYAPTDMRVLGFAVAGKDLAVAVRPYGDTGGGQVHIVNKKGEAIRTVSFTGVYRHLSGYQHRYVLLTDSYVQTLSATAEGTPVPVEADGQQVILTNHQAVVLGLNRLAAYDVQEKK
jgi:hypothetical protein